MGYFLFLGQDKTCYSKAYHLRVAGLHVQEMDSSFAWSPFERIRDPSHIGQVGPRTRGSGKSSDFRSVWNKGMESPEYEPQKRESHMKPRAIG